LPAVFVPLAATDAMYQFSLDAYSTLFHLSLSDSPEPEALADRIKALNDYHTYAVYKYASRGLFEQHKLLLSLQMCARILAASGQINAEEWQFFLQVWARVSPLQLLLHAAAHCSCLLIWVCLY
jgi:dynein heavy chain